MAQRPAPVCDLDWDPARARELGDAVVALWAELLEKLPELPVSRDFRASELRSTLPLDIGEQGLTAAELVERLRMLALESSVYSGHGGYLAYVSGAGTVPGAASGRRRKRRRRRGSRLRSPLDKRRSGRSGLGDGELRRPQGRP